MPTLTISNFLIGNTQGTSLSSNPNGRKLLNKSTSQYQNTQEVPKFFKQIKGFLQKISLENIECELKNKGINSEIVKRVAKILKCKPEEALAKVNNTFSKAKSFTGDFKSMVRTVEEGLKKLSKYFRK